MGLTYSPFFMRFFSPAHGGRCYQSPGFFVIILIIYIIFIMGTEAGGRKQVYCVSKRAGKIKARDARRNKINGYKNVYTKYG